MIVGQGGGTNAAPAKPSKLTKLTLIRGVLKRHCCDLGKVSISMHSSDARKEDPAAKRISTFAGRVSHVGPSQIPTYLHIDDSVGLCRVLSRSEAESLKKTIEFSLGKVSRIQFKTKYPKSFESDWPLTGSLLLKDAMFYLDICILT